MKLEPKKECLWIHNVWLIREQDKPRPDDEIVKSLKKLTDALTAFEPSDEQKQIIQRLGLQ